jgi:hypothetical protein
MAAGNAGKWEIIQDPLPPPAADWTLALIQHFLVCCHPMLTWINNRPVAANAGGCICFHDATPA